MLDAENPKAPARRLTDRKDPEYNGVISPDGARVLFAAITLSGTQGNLDIAAVNLDGTGLKTISSDDGKLVHQDWPSWSPDGRRFAFSSTHEGNQEIYTAAADGTDLVRLTQSPGLDAHPCWSPDGRQIAFATDRWGGLELAAIRPDGTKSGAPDEQSRPRRLPRLLTRWQAARLRLQPRPPVRDLRRRGRRVGPIQPVAPPIRDTFPTWTPDGRGVTFVSNRDGTFDLYTQMLEP